MRQPFKKFLSSLAVALSLTSTSLPSDTRAQTYPIDCAILLCLSGGWPASAPCTRARAEFIRRITPWPIEPPLQIWRCPMGASYEIDPRPPGAGLIIEAFSRTDGHGRVRSLNSIDLDFSKKSADASIDLIRAEYAYSLVQERADIDISGPEFNFVRSIRVFDIRFASQQEAGENDECRRYALVYLGTYRTQGDFSWAVSAPAALPDAHVGLEGWGTDCPNIYNRSVFVDWRDYEGEYGFEQVNY